MTSMAATGSSHARILDTYSRRTAGSLAAHTRASTRLPGGVNRNITHFAPHPLFVDHASGAYVFDLDGNQYLDLLGNYTSMIFGHGHPETVEAVRSQLQSGAAWAAASAVEFQLADTIAQRIPSMPLVRFTSSGTEATLMAIRAARAATGRDQIAKFEGGYHGQHDCAVVSLAPSLKESGEHRRPSAVAPPGVPQHVQDAMVILPFNDADAVDEILDAQGDSVAAVIVEPIMGVAGVIQPAGDFLRQLRAVTRRRGIVLIFDEVISFRLSYGGAQEMFGVQPDLTTLGKVIGGGFPIGAVGGDPAIMELFDPTSGPTVMLSGTFHANPIALHAGLATLQALDKETVNDLNSKAASLYERMNGVFAGCGVPTQLNTAGSLFNLHFSSEPVTDYRSALKTDTTFLRWVHLALLNRGMLLAPRGLGCLSVPMTDSDTELFLSQLEAALAEVTLRV